MEEAKIDDIIKEIYNCIDKMANTSLEDEQYRILQNIKQHLKNTRRIKDGYKQLTDFANENRKGETILHYAVLKLPFMYEHETKVVKSITDQYKNLVNENRAKTDFSGQKPLHIAITKGVHKIVQYLIPKQMNYVLSQDSLGNRFQKTVMMAEIPLSVAALKSVASNKTVEDLKDDQIIFRSLVLKYGARLDGENSHGDNVCHSLIRYAKLYPDKCELVKAMMEYITEEEEIGVDARNIWPLKNHEGLTPLLLAAKFGQHEIFKFIMDLKDYCFQNESDGLFDLKIYDVTEMDAISFKQKKNESDVQGISKHDAEAKTSVEGKVSVLRRLLELDPQCAFQFILVTPISRIIDDKWKTYRRYFYPLFVLHVIYMSFLTWYGTHRSVQSTNVDGGFDVSLKPSFTNPLFDQSFSLSFGILNILVGIVVLLEAVLRACLNRMPFRLSSVMNPYSNATFRLLFCVFGLCLIGDFIFAALAERYENYLLMLAVFIGWFLMLFFLRAFRPFSFFTVMIQKVLVGDLLRFSIILLCELFAFATVMFMAVQGASEVDSEYSNYGRVLLSMFKLMVGLGDVGLLYQTRHPTLTILIVVGFIILTTLLMVNSLIALISRTSEEIVDETGEGSARDMHWKLQRLSLVLYIESILPGTKFIHLVGECTDKTQYPLSNEESRWHLEIKSLLDAEDNNNVTEEPSFKSGLSTLVMQRFREQLDKVHHYDNPKSRSQDHTMSTNWQITTERSQAETMRSLQSSMEVYNHQLCTKCSEITFEGPDGRS